jgi:hypothetical protein
MAAIEYSTVQILSLKLASTSTPLPPTGEGKKDRIASDIIARQS